MSLPRSIHSRDSSASRWRRLAAWLAWPLAALALALPGCGGGGLGSGGTGAPLATGSGTITGFGSIIVDGVAYDDSAARVETDDLGGLFQRAQARLGQQVEIAFDDAGRATTFRVGAQLVGQVGSVQPLAGSLRVLGREVLVNRDVNSGPLTVFDGVLALAALRAGDWVEVHGIDSAGGDSLQATRIERLAAAPPLVRAAGRITRVLGNEAFQLAGSTTVGTASALRLPTGVSWAAGQRVTVLAPAAGVREVLGETIVSAALVRVGSEPDLGQAVSASGRLVELTASTFRLAGWLVEFGPEVIRPPASVLANGLYVRVEGVVAGPGRLIAREVRVRAFESGGVDIELRGTLTALAPDGRSFEVRGVPVTLPPTVTPQNCGSGLAEGAYVEVRAQVGVDGIVAERVECRTQEPPGSVLLRDGIALAVNESARTFDLQIGLVVSVRVVWTELTEFRDVLPTAASLNGRRVEVEGSFRLTDGAFVARRVKLR